jgi:hypothetical protein
MVKKTVYVNENTFEKIVKQLGYKPDNLIVNKFLPEDKAIISDDYEELKNRYFYGR